MADGTTQGSDVNIEVGAQVDQTAIDGAKKNLISEFSQIEERLKRIGTAEAKELAKQLETLGNGLSSGINIEVGAQVDQSTIDGAKRRIMAEFSQIEERLRRVGTAEAKELAKQLSVVSKGLSSGAFKAGDVEAVAQSFANITKDSQLSDKAIQDIASRLSGAVSASRGLSDWISRSERGVGLFAKAMDLASRGLDRASPRARDITAQIGEWAKKIPGVERFLTKMPMLGGAIGVAFKAVTATLVAVGNTMKKYQATMREIQARDRRWKEENAKNAEINGGARADNTMSAIQEQIQHEKAVMDAEQELWKLKERTALYERQAETPNAKLRGYQALNTQRDIEKRELEDRKKLIEKEIELIDAQKKAIEEKKSLAELTLATSGANLKEEQELLKKYDEARSEAQKVAERQAKEGGLLESSDGWFDKVNNYVKENLRAQMGDFTTDLWRGLKNMVGMKDNDLSTAEAQEKFKEQIEVVRRRVQEATEAQDSLKKMDLQLSALDNRRKEQVDQRDIAEESDKVRLGRIRAEEAERNHDIDMAVANKRVELMASGNRLTAMGLGGGNEGADYGRDIATNTKEMKELMKQQLKAYNRRGIAGDNELNGPHLAPRASLGDLGWMM